MWAVKGVANVKTAEVKTTVDKRARVENIVRSKFSMGVPHLKIHG